MTESVWDCPRPPRVEACAGRAAVEFGGEVVADSERALRVRRSDAAAWTYPEPVITGDIEDTFKGAAGTAGW